MMDKNGDQTVQFELFCLKSQLWQPCLNTDLYHNPDNSIGQHLGSQYDSLSQAELHIWPGGIPEREPKCDYDRASCLGDTDMALWEFSVILVASLCILVFFFGVFVGMVFIKQFSKNFKKIIFVYSQKNTTQHVSDRGLDVDRLSGLSGSFPKINCDSRVSTRQWLRHHASQVIMMDLEMADVSPVWLAVT